MARIYKFSGYALAANNEELDIESLIDQEDCDAFLRINECEFERCKNS